MSDQAKINAAINAAMGQIQKLAKGDRNQHGNYSFASVDAFLDMCRPICAEHGLHPQVDSVGTETFSAGNAKLWAKFSYKIGMGHVSGEKTDPVGMDVMLPLTGAQTSGSAQSYAVKQYLRALLLISTGERDDPDFHQPAPSDGVGVKDAAPAADYDLDALIAKMKTFKSLTGLNAWIGEMNPVLVAMHLANDTDYNRFYAFWKNKRRTFKMAAPEYKAGKVQLVRGVEIDDNMSISFWFNITDPDLRARLDAYYQANKDDFKQQPGLEIQVKIGDTFHRVARSRLWLNDGAPAQQAAVPAPVYAPPPPPPPPAPPPHTSVPDAPPPPAGYEATKNGY